ncbi:MULTISPECIES: metallophosphoesterase family protein [Myroides]|uniref:Phosphoesterase n=1 Tax=Myroides albus TaxID=2562892 RepID=A0A6I3LLH8_9FLAO|nr:MULTISPECIES: metallophosphoesterase family protein [Myroides]MTG98130.1 YfcE family phosphodiesterase [Myroides albus]MVX34729.1 YfcE family phosphodiesterase [Myroides sp. LoEW2-1]UVD78617.1 metallophosphatase family protein [Myroides albus]
MKKILLLSDTHSCVDEHILKYVREADEVWHAGDIGDLSVTDAIKALKPLKGVYGNIDDKEARLEFPEENIFDCEGMKVYMIHIGGYPGKYRSNVKATIMREKPDIYICGHSHILKVQYDQMYQVLHMNPGAAGISGFHQVRTMLRFEIDKGKISNLEIVEWPKNKKAELL